LKKKSDGNAKPDDSPVAAPYPEGGRGLFWVRRAAYKAFPFVSGVVGRLREKTKKKMGIQQS
tara:strand:- start:314 stop:499 length:186 start_codon:yes stop_codon:yes gene_type:complete